MMTDLLRKTTQDFQQRFHTYPTLFSQAPGRINILGEHTDYAGGLSLPAAIDCWTVGAWQRRNDNEIKIFSVNMDDLWDTTWTAIESGIGDTSWRKYVAGCFIVFKETAIREGNLSGVNLVLNGNVPMGGGVSSSASVELAVLNGLNSLFNTQIPDRELAKMAQQVEHRFLKVKSGLLDQFACQMAKKQSALLIDFQSLEVQQAPLAPSFDSASWVLVDSHVKRELSQSKYSERVDEFLDIQNRIVKYGHNTLREFTSLEVIQLLADAPENLRRRACHITSENERTLKAFESLGSGDVRSLGKLLFETHQSLAKNYEVSHSHLDFLVEAGKKISGVFGGRMMGGGFGGCCLFLVEKLATMEFCEKIAQEYELWSQISTQPRSLELVDGASAWTYGN